jgi:hypothetical protein
MNMFQRVLLVDPSTGFYKTKKYGFDRYFGPVEPRSGFLAGFSWITAFLRQLLGVSVCEGSDTFKPI